MALNVQQVQKLKDAIQQYNFPKVTYDFRNQQQIGHPNMRSVEDTIRSQLLSSQPQDVKFGLANVLYWGYAGTGFRCTRVRIFLAKVEDAQLLNAINVFNRLSKQPGLIAISKIGLPEFSKISFLSKVRMFLDPTHFVVLDRKLMKLSQSAKHTLFKCVKADKTSIPRTRNNEIHYEEWCRLCRSAATTYFDNYPGIIAVDVERAIWQLVKSGEIARAANTIANI